MSKKRLFVIGSLADIALVTMQTTSLYLLWNWFIPDQFTLPRLNPTTAFIMILMTRIFSYRYKKIELNMSSTEMVALQEQTTKAVTAYTFNNLFIVIGGWIVHHYFL